DRTAEGSQRTAFNNGHLNPILSDKLRGRERYLLLLFLSLLDEDALARTLFGGLAGGVFHALRNNGQAFMTARIVEDLVALFNVRQPVVEQREDRRGDLLAETVASTEILVDPYLHGCVLPRSSTALYPNFTGSTVQTAPFECQLPLSRPRKSRL